MAETAKTYPTSEQYDRWKARADELDMSVSEFIQNMVEAGMKVDRGFDVELHPDETVEELRRDRNDWRRETERLRERVAELEERVYDSERSEMEDFISQHPTGVRYRSIVDHIRATVPERVNDHLDAMMGEQIAVDRENPDYEQYVPADAGEEA